MAASDSVLFPEVEVSLIGADGNVFNIIGLVAAGLRDAGHREAADAFRQGAFMAGSYDEVLVLAMRTVTVV